MSHNFINYNRTGEIVEIIIRDFSGARIEGFKAKIKDREKVNKIMHVLKKKYDFKPEVTPKDLEWLK